MSSRRPSENFGVSGVSNGIKKQEWLAKGRSEHQKLGVVLGGNNWKQVLLFFFFGPATRNCTTLYTIPAMTLRTRVGIPLILLRTFIFLFAGVCGFGCFTLSFRCFPVLPICRPKAIIPNSE